MSNQPDIFWEGQSGNKYGYWISPINDSFKKEPGNYVFAKQTKPNHWRPIYIGQTNNLLNRLSNHEKMDCAITNGATHIHTHTNPNGENARLLEESDLINKWNPVCND